MTRQPKHAVAFISIRRDLDGAELGQAVQAALADQEQTAKTLPSRQR